MYNFKKKYSSKTLLTIIIVMTLSFVMLFSTACGKTPSSGSDSESDSSKAFPSDYQTITNGDFEFNTQTYKYTNYPVNSSIGWTRSNDSITNSATTSTKTSGIIDTTEWEFLRDKDGNVVYGEDGTPEYAKDKNGDKIPVFSVIAPKHLPVVSGTDGEDDAVYYNPYTPYYYGLVDTEEGDPKDGDPTKGTKVLMIANKTATEGKGTAQKFSSTKTLTLYPGEYAQVSVWVKTYNLKTLMDTKDFGAYISLSSLSVGSVTKENFAIKYINTYGQWMKYTINVAGSDYATTSYKVILGLGNGSKDITSEYVEGYAFFDNVTYKTLTKEEYDATTADKTVNFYTKNGSEETFSEDTSEMKILANTVFADENAVNKNDAATGEKYSQYTANLNFARTGYSALTVDGTAKKNEVYDRNHGEDFGNADVGVKPWNAIGEVTNGIEYPFDEATPTVYFNFANPASYTFTSSHYTVGVGKYMRVTFWAKVNLNNKSAKSFNINIIDTTADGKYTNKTAVKESLETSDMKNEAYGDWIKYTVIVNNTFAKEDSSYAKDRYFDFEFSFGPTTNTSDILDFPTGYAFVTNFEYSYLSEDDYKQVYTSDSNYKAVALSADMQSSSFTEAKESYKFNYPFFEDISNTVSEDVTGYMGFVGNSLKVGGTEENKLSQEETKAGIINTKYLDNYVTSGLFTADEKTNIENWLKDVDLGDNEYLQPIIIKNTADASYGFQQSTSSTFSANTVYEVSVKLYIMGEGTKAYVYLTDGDNSSDFKVLKISASKNDYTNEEAFEKELATQLVRTDWENAAVKESGKVGRSWLEVKFYVTTGNKPIDYKVEVWNGSRDGSVKSTGTVVIGDINVASITSDDIALAKRQLTQSFNDENAYKFVFEDGIHYTRLPSTVKTDKNPDGEIRNYEKTDENNAGIAYYSNKIASFVDYSNINVESELDERTTEDSSSSSSSSDSTATTNPNNESSFSYGLYAATLSVSIALIVVLLIILGRKIYKTVKSKKKSTKTYYSRDTRAKAMEKISNSKTAKIQLTDENEEKTDYDYDNMENNVVQEPAENSEETTDNAETSEDGETAQPENGEEQTENVETTEETPAETPAETPVEAPVEEQANSETTTEESEKPQEENKE